MLIPKPLHRRLTNLSLAVLFAHVAGLQIAHSDFSNFYSENEETLPQFDSGGLFTSKEGVGYVLIGSSQVDSNPPATYPVPSLARFEEANSALWSVYMDAGPDTRDRELIADLADSSKFFAGFVEDGVSARVGLYNGSDLSSLFALQIPMQANSPLDVSLSYFPGMLSSVLQNLGSSIQLLILDSSGSRVFEKTYASADFLGIQIPGLSTQSVFVSQIPDKSGFYISVMRSDLDFLTTTYRNRFFLINVDTAGTPRWSKTFEIETNTPGTDTSGPSPDNGYLYRIVDVNPSSGLTTTNLIKLSSSGGLDFSESIDNLRLLSSAETSAGSSLILSGTITDPSSLTASDFGAVKINSSSGAIEAQVGVDQAMGEFGFISGSAAGMLFGSLIYSDDPQFDDTSTALIRFDLNLSNPFAADYSGINEGGLVSFKSETELLFSPFNSASGAAGAFTLDPGFVPATAGCVDFTEVALNTFDPELTVVPLSLTLDDVELTVGDSASALNATTLPVEMLELSIESCVADGPLTILSQPANETVSSGQNATFSVTASGTGTLMYQWKKDGVDIVGATSSALQISGAQESDEGSYTVQITDDNGSVLSDPATLTVNVAAGLTITQQPVSQSVLEGGSTVLVVTATGTGTLMYQWKKDGVDIPGATLSTLSLLNFSESDVGDYTVVVSNETEMVTSSAATLSILTGQNAGFDSYLATLGVPENMRGLTDDPDNDGVFNIFEYLMGTNANDPGSTPIFTPSIVTIGNDQYLAVSYTRDTSITDLALGVAFSESLPFVGGIESVVETIEDLGSGIERVTERSGTPIGASSQFSRISVGE